MQHNDTRHGGRNGTGSTLGSRPIREFKVPAISSSDPAAVAVQLFLVVGYHRLRAMEEPARQGEVEGVHRLRTATRRLRSDLRTFRGLLEAGWAEPIESELKWLGELLGGVRDLDVLQSRLAQAAGESAGTLAPLFDSLAQRHTQASSALHSGLLSPRYARLIERLADAAERPALGDDAQEPCRTALPPLVGKAWVRLKKPARRIVADSPDEDLHEVRKRAKRARYAAESVAVALDESVADAAARFARRATALQDILGEHQDAVVACAEIQRVAEAHPHAGPFNFAAGRLMEKQAVAADAARGEFFKAWDRLDRKKNRRWFKT